MASKKSKKNIITFDEECDANKIRATISNHPKNSVKKSVGSENDEHNREVPSKKRENKNRKRSLQISVISQNDEQREEPSKKKRKKKSEEDENLSDDDIDEQRQKQMESEDVDAEQNIKKQDSIREQKRKKHAVLLETRKIKADQGTQQMALNYLSKWKYARDEWKFEKLRQIWLSENLFDCSKLPNDMWLTAVEYFSNSKGFIRKLIMREALKVLDAVEDAGEPDSDNKDDNQALKLSRARDIIQYLKEV